jgi:DNA polymerase-1
MDTSAIMGFMNSLMDVIKGKTGSFSGRFDNGGSQLRNEIFQNIKRTVMPLPKR